MTVRKRGPMTDADLFILETLLLALLESEMPIHMRVHAKRLREGLRRMVAARKREAS